MRSEELKRRAAQLMLEIESLASRVEFELLLRDGPRFVAALEGASQELLRLSKLYRENLDHNQEDRCGDERAGF